MIIACNSTPAGKFLGWLIRGGGMDCMQTSRPKLLAVCACALIGRSRGTGARMPTPA
jgi:hypothetical protein